MEQVKTPERLRLSELMFYQESIAEAISFYCDRLGWRLVANYGNSYALVSVDGAYDLAISDAKFSSLGWEPGQYVPAPVLNVESSDLNATVARLRQRGIAVSEPSGSVDSIVTSSFSDSEGHVVMLWQDANSKAASSKWPGALDVPEREVVSQRYALCECLYIASNLGSLKTEYMGTLGLSIADVQGDVYIGLRIGDGLMLGLFDRAAWMAEGSHARQCQAVLSLECKNIDNEHQRLERAGLPLGSLRNKSSMHWFTVDDPGGNKILFWQARGEGA